MATYLRLLSVLLALSIVGDILHIKDVWFDGGEENGNSLGKLKYSLPLPGAESYAKSYAGLSSASLSWTKKLAKAVAKKKGDGSDKSTFGLTKSAIKAAKKLAKVTAKKIGDARNKRRRRREHTRNRRPSTKNKHEKANARRNKEQNKPKDKKG